MVARAITDITATIARLAVHLAGNLRGKYACGNGDNGITGEHRQGGNHLAQCSLWCYITVAHSGNGHNGPIDTSGDTGKAILWTFNKKHQAAKDHTEHQHYGKKHKYLAPCGVHGAQKNIRLREVAHQFEHPKHTQHPQ